MATTSGALFSSLTESPHAFLQPSLPLYTDTLAYLKHALDPLAADVSTLQQQRLQESRKKRKRGDRTNEEDVLRLKQIHTEGFGQEQVWEQARRVIEAARTEAERGLEEAQQKEQADAEGTGSEDGLEEGLDGDDESLGEEGVDYEVEGIDDDDMEDAEDEEDLDGALDEAEGGGEDDYDEEDVELDGEDGPNGEEDEQPAEEFVADKFGLNDGFFSIDNFNKQSEFLEQADVRGDEEDAGSDEEDVDWDADPLGQSMPKGDANGMEGESDDEDEEDGPTFGDPDAPSEEENEDAEVGGGDLDAMGGMGNTNDIMYNDFFAPPAQKKRKNKKGRPNPHNFPAAGTGAKNEADEPEDDDMERTRDAVHRDLFEDEDSAEEEDDEEGEQLDPADPRSRRSTHERRKAALQEEIRKLEAANVAKRDWQLQGEARGADRPTNALLEEDLEFERAGKPVPVITAEVSESIEDLIKRRILAHDFQDIIRRRPDDLATGPTKRGRLDMELDDSKSKKGLAEEYEEDHLRRNDPNFVDAKDEKVKKEEQEIEALWNKVRTDLDSLSSWNFRPKAPAPSMDIRVDAPVISMEDARPSAGGEVASASQLAPQEVYKAGEGVKGVNEEVAGKSGLPAAREELSREDKKRRRRREKERIRKASGNEPVAKAAGEGKAGKQTKKDVVDDLRKGNVKVIGKKGKVTDVEGKEAKGHGGAQTGAGMYKL